MPGVAQPILPPGMASTSLPTLPSVPAPSSTGQGTGIGTVQLSNPNTSIGSGLSTKDGSHTLVGDFKDSFGAGTGTALADTIAGLGTSTDKAVQATNQSILNAAGIQQANIIGANAAAGLSKDSSSSALALGDFNSQVNQQIATTDAQMELSEENLLIQSLFEEGGAHGSDSSFMKSLGNFFQGGGLNIIGDVAHAVGSLPGIGGFADSALSALAEL